MNIDPLDPAALGELLDVLRQKGVASAHITATAVNVVFEPRLDETMPGTQPTPGGWKSPAGLDAVEQFDTDRREVP